MPRASAACSPRMNVRAARIYGRRPAPPVPVRHPRGPPLHSTEGADAAGRKPERTDPAGAAVATSRSGENTARGAPRLMGDSAAAPIAQTVLAEADFLALLRRERHRADRSGEPLSILVFRYDGALDARSADIRELTELLRHEKRETDSLGGLGAEVALLCPYTAEEGADALMRKVAERAAGMPFEWAAATYPHQLFGQIEQIDQGAADGLAFGPFPACDAAVEQARGYALKRALDVVGASLALVLLSPLMLLTALAIVATSPGPAIFRQTRLGRNGVPFDFYKFRSMAYNVDDAIHREFTAVLIAKGRAFESLASGALASSYKMRGDPRITTVGRWIRRASIDEIPQFWNVLRGEMSLVGSRPPLPYEAQRYEPWHLRRVLGLRPGITGLWQVEGRSRVSFDEMVRMDLRYVRHCSLWLDLKILLRTFKVVLRCEGAS